MRIFCFFDIYFQNFNETLTNDVVDFEQPVPGRKPIINMFVGRDLFHSRYLHHDDVRGTSCSTTWLLCRYNQYQSRDRKP